MRGAGVSVYEQAKAENRRKVMEMQARENIKKKEKEFNREAEKSEIIKPKKSKGLYIISAFLILFAVTLLIVVLFIL